MKKISKSNGFVSYCYIQKSLILIDSIQYMYCIALKNNVQCQLLHIDDHLD